MSGQHSSSHKRQSLKNDQKLGIRSSSTQAPRRSSNIIKHGPISSPKKPRNSVLIVIGTIFLLLGSYFLIDDLVKEPKKFKVIYLAYIALILVGIWWIANHFISKST